LETVVKEVLDHLGTLPSPLAQSPPPYDSSTIRALLGRLRPYSLTKAEVIMILNHRPTSVSMLNTLVEELEDRFPDHADQRAMVAAIRDVLGVPADQAREMEAMTGAARDARERDVAGSSEVTHERGDA
jgi:hypothetical protein